MKPANSAAVRVDIPVGSRWRYAGGGYSIVQLAVQDVTKKTFADAARELVLEPLGMLHSTFAQPIPAALRSSAATGYGPSGDPIAGRFHTHPGQAAAGLWTTPEDLTRFAIALQQIAVGNSRQTIMSRDLAAQMMRPVLDEYGLGFGVTGTGRETQFGHGGSNVGFRCQLTAFKDEASGVAIMTNSDRGGAILQEVVRAVARDYGWAGIAPLERTLGTADPATYKDFAGRYDSDPIAAGHPDDRNGRQQAIPRYRPRPRRAAAESATTFFATDRDMRIEFVRDVTGKVTAARVWQGSVEREATRQQES